jgi:hypothetical protein
MQCACTWHNFIRWVLTLVSRFLQTSVIGTIVCTSNNGCLEIVTKKTTPQFAESGASWAVLFSNNSKHCKTVIAKTPTRMFNQTFSRTWWVPTNKWIDTGMHTSSNTNFYSKESNNMPSKKSSCTAAPAHSYSSTRFRNARRERLSCSEQLCNLTNRIYILCERHLYCYCLVYMTLNMLIWFILFWHNIPETTSQITSCLQRIFKNLHGLHFQIVSKKFEHDRSRRTYKGLFAQKNICKVVDPEAVGFEEPVSSYRDWSDTKKIMQESNLVHSLSSRHCVVPSLGLSFPKREKYQRMGILVWSHFKL